MAGLDALQYLDGGPCEEAVGTGSFVEADSGSLMDEGRWRLFARGSESCGVGSTLSLPILEGERVVGGVDVYGTSADTFTVVTGSSPRSSVPGRPAPSPTPISRSAAGWRPPRPFERLDDLGVVDLAVGILVGAPEVSPAEARQRLQHAAAWQAEVTVVEAADLVRCRQRDR